MKKYLQIAFIFVIVALSIRFFDCRVINKSFINYSNLLACVLVICISAPFFLRKQKSGFILPVQLIVVAIAFSFFMANISWYQKFTDSLTITAPYLLWIFFFYLLYVKVPVKTIEKIVLVYGVLYVILYFFQLRFGPKVYFGQPLEGGTEYTEDRGILRIIFPAGGIFVLASFIALNKLTTGAKGRWFWLAFTLLGVVIPFLQVTRLFIAGVLLIYLYHFIKKMNLLKKALIMGVFATGLFIVGNSNLPMVQGLKEESKYDAHAGEDYVRVKAAKYFLNDFSPSDINKVFGNGAPFTNFTYYGKTMERLQQEDGFYLEDVGIIAMYVMFGIIPIIALIMIWYKSFVIKIPDEYSYVKYYLWYLLFTCLTTFYVYHPYYLISSVFALYIYQTVYEQQQIKQALARILDPAEEIEID